MREALGGAGVTDAWVGGAGAGDAYGGWLPELGIEPGPKLRVLHVAEAFGGGLMEMVRFLCNQAAIEGHSMAIAYGRRRETPEDVRSLLHSRVDLFPQTWDRDDPRTHLNVRAELRRLVDEWAPDVVHLHSSFAGVVGMAALRRRVPLVFTPHAFASSVQSHSPHARVAYAAIERAVVRRATLVGAVSESEAREARALGGRNVAVIPNGIPELDSPHVELGGTPAKARPPLAVGVGRLIGQRNPDACARILGAVGDAGDVAWLGGGGACEEDEERARTTLEAAGVPVSGWLAREELKRRLGEATAYLHWTTWDGMALSILEAMALDVVVVASRTDPSCEILPPDHICDSEEEASALLRRILRDPDLAERMRASQRERRGRYSAERMTATWLERYRELAPAAEPVAVTALAAT